MRLDGGSQPISPRGFNTASPQAMVGLNCQRYGLRCLRAEANSALRVASGHYGRDGCDGWARHVARGRSSDNRRYSSAPMAPSRRQQGTLGLLVMCKPHTFGRFESDLNCQLSNPAEGALKSEHCSVGSAWRLSLSSKGRLHSSFCGLAWRRNAPNLSQRK